MKKIGLSAIVISLIGLNSCDSLDELKTIDLETDVKHSIEVAIADTDPTSVSESFNVDASTSSDVSDYLDKIKEYTVNKVTYKIKNYTGAEGIILDGQAKFGSIAADIDNLDLLAAATAATDFELAFDQNALTALAADFKNGNAIEGVLEGTVSGKPVNFTVEFVFDIGLKVEVL